MDNQRLLAGKIKRHTRAEHSLNRPKQDNHNKKGRDKMATEYALPKTTSSNIVDVTPTMAKRWLDTHTYERQRRIRKYHVNHLANMMTRGHFRAGSPIDFAYHANKWYLVNGQHTLNAMVESGVELSLNVMVHSCKSMAEVNKIYASFDRQLKRTTKDTMAAYDIAGIDELRSDIKASAYVATGMATMGLESSLDANTQQYLYPWHNDQEMRAKIVESWMTELQVISQDAITESGNTKSIVSKQGFLSVALITYRFSEEKARDFWQGIMLDDGLARDDPRKAFIRAYQADRTEGRSKTLSTRSRQRYSALYAASAWNLFLANRSIMQLKTPTADRYIRINNTPHNGKVHLVYVDADWNILREPVDLKSEDAK